jgi:ParB/RepB/Spo0J family partition protein
MTPERNIQSIPIASIDRDGQNHRVKVPGDKEAIRVLSESMSRHRQLSPVAVLHLPDRGRYLLIFGFRRVAAAEVLGWTEIAAEVFTDLDPATVMHMRAVENLERKDLNPIEEAVAVAQLLDAAGGDVGRCAASIGRSESWVRDRCYLRRLGEKTRQRVIDGKLLLGHAREIAKLPDADVQETLAEWCKVGDDGTCGRRLDQLRRDVENRMNSLKVVPWNLDVDFAGKPACGGCCFNSSNDRNLFEHDEPSKVPPEGFCMSPACYEAKQKASEKALEKAVNKIVNQGAAATAKAAEKTAPDFLKTARVIREVKKVRGEDVEREGKPKEDGPQAPKQSVNELAERRLQVALGQWEAKAAAGITAACHADKQRMIALILLNETDWASRLWQQPEAISSEGFAMVEAAAACNIDGLFANVAKEGYEPPIVSDLPPEAVSVFVSAWGIELPPKPTLEDFLNAKQPEAEEPERRGAGSPAEDPCDSEPPAAEEAEDWDIGSDTATGEIPPEHMVSSAVEPEPTMEETFRSAAAEATEEQLKALLERIAATPNPDGADPLRRKIVEAELGSRAEAREVMHGDGRLETTKPDDEIEALDLSDAIQAKLRRHDLHTIDAIRRAGGGDCTKLTDLSSGDDRFGPREVTAIRKAVETQEKTLAAQVVGPASNEVHELTEP